MENVDPKGNDPSEGELDRILDATLAKYASAEPRTGLEERILATLHSPEISVHRARWYWSLAAALAILVIVLALGLRSSRNRREIAHQNLVPTEAVPSQRRSQRLDHVNGAGRPTPIHLAGTHPLRRKTAAPKNPKLDQFPSPHPLSEQEQMLARYVAQFNDEAVIVARVRTEATRLDREKEMQEAEPSGNQDLRTR